jgi:hypothetical protein
LAVNESGPGAGYGSNRGKISGRASGGRCDASCLNPKRVSNDASVPASLFVIIDLP